MHYRVVVLLGGVSLFPWLRSHFLKIWGGLLLFGLFFPFGADAGICRSIWNRLRTQANGYYVVPIHPVQRASQAFLEESYRRSPGAKEQDFTGLFGEAAIWSAMEELNIYGDFRFVSKFHQSIRGTLVSYRTGSIVLKNKKGKNIELQPSPPTPSTPPESSGDSKSSHSRGHFLTFRPILPRFKGKWLTYVEGSGLRKKEVQIRDSGDLSLLAEGLVVRENHHRIVIRTYAGEMREVFFGANLLLEYRVGRHSSF